MRQGDQPGRRRRARAPALERGVVVADARGNRRAEMGVESPARERGVVAADARGNRGAEKNNNELSARTFRTCTSGGAMFSFPTSVPTTKESCIELGGPFAFAAASFRGIASLGARATRMPLTCIDLAVPRSFECVCPPVSARRTFEPEARGGGFRENIAASPRCRDEASRAARDSRTRAVKCSGVRDDGTCTARLMSREKNTKICFQRL